MGKKATKDSGNSSTGSRNNLLFGFILIVIFAVVYGKVFDQNLDLNGDNFDYLLLSKNILNGHGYSKLAVDGSYRPAGWFPPGYPYVLAIDQFFLGEEVNGLKRLNGLFFLLSVLLFFFISKKLSGNQLFAFSIAVLLVLNSGLLRLATIIMSEIPYLFFTLLAIYSLLKVDDQSGKKPFWKSGWFYLTAISSIISYYIRGFGITIILAITLHWLMNKKWKQSAVFLLTNLLLYLPYFIRNKIHGIEGRYAKMIFVDNPWRPESGGVTTLAEFLDKITVNLKDTVIYGFPKVLFPSIDVSDPTTLLTLFGIAVVCFSFLGVWYVKKYQFLFGSFLLLNIGILLLWHTGNGVRYVWPLAGFIMFTSFYGLYALIVKFLKPTAKYWVLVFLFLGFFHIGNINELASQAKLKLHPAYENYFKIAKAIKGQGKDYLVVCRKPSLFAYYSASRTSGYLSTTNDKELIQHLVDMNADYVVIDQLGYSSTPRYLVPAIQKNAHLFKTAMHLPGPDTYLLWFDKERAKNL